MSNNDLISALPKTDLHLHLIGSASAETVRDLAMNSLGSRVPTDLAELSAFYAFRDFPHFLEVYELVNSLVTRRGHRRACSRSSARCRCLQREVDRANGHGRSPLPGRH